MTVKNLTVSVPDEVYRAARVRAAEQGVSLSALVTEYLRSMASRSNALAAAADRRAQLRSRLDRFTATDRLTRDEVHARGPIR